jgi:hypothetical protein
VSNESKFYLGASCPLDGRTAPVVHSLPAHHLVTHGVVLGMTGSGKTGLIHVLVEEALNAGVPVLMIDVKGDLPNLMLTFPSFAAEHIQPWVENNLAPSETRTPRLVAEAQAQLRKQGLENWGIGEAELASYVERTQVRIITPGLSSGELLHVLSSLERRSARWDDDPESARAALSAAVSLLLRLLGRDPDPAKSKEHVLLCVLAELRLSRGETADLASLLLDLEKPPITHIGALTIDAFLPKGDRRELAAGLNTLLASPTFVSWRQGTTLDVAEWLKPQGRRTPAVIVSVAHLDDDERALVLGVLLEEVLNWVRSLPGSQRLRALVVFDEVYGFLPPHPQNPPTKRPLVALMKQARAFGVGVVVATQNPMDLDYRALSNAGLWCVGRLQTDADRARVVEGLSSAGAGGGYSASELAGVLKQLAPRWFLMRDAHADAGTLLLQPRWAMSFMRGPMTRSEIRKAREAVSTCEAAE